MDIDFNRSHEKLKRNPRLGAGFTSFAVVLAAVLAILGWLSSTGCQKSQPIEVPLNIGAGSGERAEVSGWPNLYGPTYNSVSREQGLNTVWDGDGPPVVWSRISGSGYAAPIVSEGKLVTIFRELAESPDGSADNDSPQDGPGEGDAENTATPLPPDSLLPSTPQERSLYKPPAVADFERVECLDAKTGEVLWTHRLPTTYTCSFEYSSGPYSTPVANGEVVVTVSATGIFHCFDLATGDIRWQRPLLQDYDVQLKEWPVTASPLLWQDRIIFNLGAKDQQAGIVALDLATGETLWSATDHDFCHASPCYAKIHGKHVVFVMTDEGLVCLDPEDGQVHWEVEHRIRPRDRYNAVSPVVVGDQVCIVTGPMVKPGLRCLKIMPDLSYTEPWSDIRLLNSQYTNLVFVQGVLFGFTPMKQGGPELRCIDTKQGELNWTAQLEIGRGNLLAVEDRLLILGEHGHLVCLQLDAGQANELCRTSEPVLDEPCYTSMALVDGLLYARNEQQLVCFSLRDSSESDE